MSKRITFSHVSEEFLRRVIVHSLMTLEREINELVDEAVDVQNQMTILFELFSAGGLDLPRGFSDLENTARAVMATSTNLSPLFQILKARTGEQISLELPPE